MGSKNSKNSILNPTDIINQINKINEITKNYIFINKNNIFLEFTFISMKKIKVKIMDYDNKSGLFNPKKRTKFIKANIFYNYYNTLMNSLNIFTEKFIKERVSRMSEEDKLNCSMEENSLCALCLAKKVNFSLPCCHFFCEDCIKTWILKSETCPLCRAELKCDKKTPEGISGSGRWSLLEYTKNDQNQMNQYNEEILMDLNNKLFMQK